MNFLSWIAFGVLIGIISTVLDPNPARGTLLGSVGIGIFGAVLGGLLSLLLFNTKLFEFSPSGLFIAIIGASLLVAIQQLFIKRTKHIKTTRFQQQQ